MAALLVMTLSPMARAKIPYYVDVSSTHWAATEIWSLWSVNVTDGWIEDNGFVQWNWFRPEQAMTRVEYAVMLDKAFGLVPQSDSLPYSDVPPVFQVYSRFDAVPWLVAGYREGLFASIRDGRFRPSEPVSRQAAVAWLVEALDLDAFARSLSPADVQAQLNRFRDAASVDPGLAPQIAAAVRLGILRGYPDGTLQPLGVLKRCEAAALIYRSAWVTVRADPDHVSPDGDGVGDSTRLVGHSLQNGNIDRWSLWIEDDHGRVVRSFPGARYAHGSRYETVWEGSDDSMRALPPGLYFVRAGIRSTEAVYREAMPSPVWVDSVWLAASLSPARVAGGGQVTLVATTSLIGDEVIASGPWGEAPLAMGPAAGGGRQWSATVTVPPSTLPGDAPVTFRAHFGNGARREAVVNLHVDAAAAPPSQAGDDGATPGDVLVVLTGT